LAAILEGWGISEARPAIEPGPEKKRLRSASHPAIRTAMNAPLTRRSLIGAGLTLPLLALPGCANFISAYRYDSALRRLLAYASQRAFASLLRDRGFYQDQVAQVTLPAQLGGSGAVIQLAPLLQTPAMQDNLLRLVNAAATDAARYAAPLVTQAIRGIDVRRAVKVIRGGPTAATDFLHRSMGNAVYDAMLPAVGNALRAQDNGTLTRALQAAGNFGFAALQHDVAYKASEGIYRAIGREEAAIRVNPASTDDDLLKAIFKPLGPSRSDARRRRRRAASQAQTPAAEVSQP
jgi:hypothetical protein